VLEYRERLWPRWWVWVVLTGLVAMLAVAYGSALGAAVGWLVAALGALATVALVAATTPRVTVSAAGLSAGGAVLPADCLGSCRTLTAEEVRGLRGPGADARVFTVLRPWSAAGAVLVEVDDPEDPHPAWLVSARRPARLCAALGSQRTN
jgi:hypothetical protein